MPVRRLTPLRVIITGVENSGKSTLTEHLADALDWQRVEEAARHDEAVIAQRTTPADLQRLLDGLNDALQVWHDTLFDTGPVVLDVWARTLWNHTLTGVDTAMAEVDLFLFCETLPNWEPDPLRSLPRLEDRLALQQTYAEALTASGRPWVALPPLPIPARIRLARKAIDTHFAR